MAIDFENTPTKWQNKGTEPSDDLKSNGYQPGYKPPAQVFNYLQNNTSECLSELQTKLSDLDGDVIKGVKGNGSTINPSSTGIINITPNNIGAATATHYHSANQITSGTLSIVRGGTGATTAEEARTNLGVASSDLSNVDNTVFLEKATSAGVGSSSSGGGVGKDLTGQTVSVSYDTETGTETTATAGTNAEIFNDYRERTYSSSGKIGQGNIASGNYSHAEGSGTTASGNWAHAEGSGTTASGNYSHAEGIGTKATRAAAHAEGYYTTASSDYSHAEGYYTTASGRYSHADGYYTKASGDYSHASGYFTEAKSFQSVFGKYNAVSNGPSTYNEVDGDIFIVGRGESANSKGNAFRIATIGNVYALGSFTGSGADYAEYFEWLDGNPEDEKRRGYFVTLDGDKIRKATDKDEYILGVVSATPAVEGDAHSENWCDMYLRDVFGEKLIETVEVEETTNEQGEVIPAHTEKRWILNPEYDSSLVYENRESRKEWSAVGLMGKLVVIDDGTCQVNGYCKPNSEGIATASDTGYRVMKRLDENHVRILLK